MAKFGAPVANVTVEDFTKGDLFYQMGVPPNRIDIAMGIGCISFADAWQRRVLSDFDGVPAWFISREDLIKNKQAVGRRQDREDVRQLKRQARFAARSDSNNYQGQPRPQPPLL